MYKNLLFLFLFLIVSSSLKAQFPYVESFRNSTARGIVFGGAPDAFLTAKQGTAPGGGSIDPDGQGFLRLTSNVRNQKGFAYSTTSFPSSKGLKLDFEYFIYGGTGADGISVFLFDATADPFIIGGFGGSLGYAQINTTTPVSPGLSKAYLGVGIDEFGNFSNPNEGRQGGIAGQRPGSVTLRGKGDGAALTPDNYKFLTSVKTSELGFSLVGASAVRSIDSNSVNYRKVFISMNPNPRGGFNVTVKIKRGGAIPVTSTVIDNFYYPEPAPQNLRYGFASSTGNQANFHEIRNVFIDVINAEGLQKPVAANDSKTLYVDSVGILDVLANDSTPNTGGVIVASSIDLDPVLDGIQQTFTVAGKGGFFVNGDSKVVFNPVSGFQGNVSCNYIITDSYGATSNPGIISLTYIPNASPGENTLPLVAPNIDVQTTSGSNAIIDIPLVPGTFIAITSGPKNGTITIDAVTGLVTYTPNPGYFGPDDFEYVYKDNAGNQSAPGKVALTVSKPVKIGLAKSLAAVSKNIDGSYNLKFTFTIVNYGNYRIDKLSLTDDLLSVFPGASFNVSALSASGDLQINSGFNGITDKELLLNTSSIQALYKETVTLDLIIAVNTDQTSYYNTAFIRGVSVRDGTETSDQSTTGLTPDSETSGDPGPSIPTLINLEKETLFIPGGFSPNNDGINDYLIIENAFGKTLNLEIFNRWGNRVYKSKAYFNNWDGKATEGLHLGEDLPVGTYYYVVILDGKDKKAGYITLNR